MPPADTRPRRGNRPPPRQVEVVAVERLAPRLVSVTFGGPALEGFAEPAPTAHIKVFLPDADGRLSVPVAGPDGVVWPDVRPTLRTYTPRRYDPAARTLEVWFVLHGEHGEGPASTWAAEAKVGDRAAIGGPGGRFVLDPGATRWWVGGDESALPAIATLIEALPAHARARVHIEIEHDDDRVELPAHPGVEVSWLRRAGDGPDRWGARLVEAVRAVPGTEPDDTSYWVACEAAAVRRIRRHLLVDAGVHRDRVTTRGYWRLGEADHPDHDYGDD